jgi:hypothetical protein
LDCRFDAVKKSSKTSLLTASKVAKGFCGGFGANLIIPFGEQALQTFRGLPY